MITSSIRSIRKSISIRRSIRKSFNNIRRRIRKSIRSMRNVRKSISNNIRERVLKGRKRNSISSIRRYNVEF